jgi:hypothetical protein
MKQRRYSAVYNNAKTDRYREALEAILFATSQLNIDSPTVYGVRYTFLNSLNRDSKRVTLNFLGHQ